MQRRNFLKNLALLTGAGILAPKMLVSENVSGVKIKSQNTFLFDLPFYYIGVTNISKEPVCDLNITSPSTIYDERLKIIYNYPNKPFNSNNDKDKNNWHYIKLLNEMNFNPFPIIEPKFGFIGAKNLEQLKWVTIQFKNYAPITTSAIWVRDCYTNYNEGFDIKDQPCNKQFMNSKQQVFISRLEPNCTFNLIFHKK